MKPSNETPSDDQKLDELLASRPVAASPGFEAGVLARIRETAIDDSLDTLLQCQQIETSLDFTEKTLALIRAEQRKRRSPVIFPQVFWWIGAAAAMLVVGLFMTSFWQEPVIPKNTAKIIPSEEFEDNDLFVLAEIEDILVLADGLSDAELFLDEGAYAALDTLSYNENVLF